MEIKSFIRANLKWVFAGLFGLLNFILLAIPYSAYCSYSGNVWSENYAETLRQTRSGISGYDLVDLGRVLQGTDAAAAGSAAATFNIFALLVGLAMLAICACGILKYYGILSIPDKLGRMKTDFVVDIAFFAMIGLNLLVMICLSAVHGISLTERQIGDDTFTIGYALSAGVFLTLIFATGAYAAMIVLDKKLPTDPGIVKICTVCGKRNARKSNFCTACGAPTEERKEGETIFVCEKCGKKARFKDKYCSACGGKILAKKKSYEPNNAKTEELIKETDVQEGNCTKGEEKEVVNEKSAEKSIKNGNDKKLAEKETEAKDESQEI